METEPNAEARIRDLTGAMDEETLVWSGGFECSVNYQKLLAEGVAALPVLFEELDKQNFWWSRMELIAEITKAAGNEIQFPDEARDWDAEKGVEYIVAWGKQFGYYNPAPADSGEYPA